MAATIAVGTLPGGRRPSGPDATFQTARDGLLDASRQLATAYPDSDRGWSVTVVPLEDAVVGDVRRPLLVLLAAVAAVLLIACANVTSLLVARGVSRSREFAVRAAVGASAGRLLRMQFVEALMLSAIGGVAGLALSPRGRCDRCSSRGVCRYRCSIAAIAVLLTLVGISGVVSQAVAQSTREIGVRIALGASGADVVSLLVRRAIRMAAAGILAGSALAWLAAPALGSMVYGVAPRDPATLAAAAVLLMAAASLSAYAPARRILRLDVLNALRVE